MGTGYKGNSPSHLSIADNIPGMKSRFPYGNGYFGSKGESKNNQIRHIEDDDPISVSKEFYDRIAYGGTS